MTKHLVTVGKTYWKWKEKIGEEMLRPLSKAPPLPTSNISLLLHNKVLFLILNIAQNECATQKDFSF